MAERKTRWRQPGCSVRRAVGRAVAGTAVREGVRSPEGARKPTRGALRFLLSGARGERRNTGKPPNGMPGARKPAAGYTLFRHSQGTETPRGLRPPGPERPFAGDSARGIRPDTGRLLLSLTP
jgi:hypothetical protein